MSALPDPQFDGPRAERPLSDRERSVLDDIAGRENAGDPGFVSRLRSTERPDAPPLDGDEDSDGRRDATRREVVARARRRDLAIQGAVVGGLAALLLPAAWVVAVVVTLVLLVLPLVLVAQAWREAHGPRGARGHRARPIDPGAGPAR